MLEDVRESLLDRSMPLKRAIERIRDEAGGNLTDIRLRWLQNELTGYPKRELDIAESSLHEPQYRKLLGTYLAQVPSGEWVDVSDTNIGDYPAFLGFGIGAIEEFLQKAEEEWYDLSIVVKGIPFKLRIRRDQLVNIGESVRSRLIDLIDELKAEATS